MPRLPAPHGVLGILVLGRFTVLRDAEELPPRAFGGRRAQRLLRLLALRRGTLVSKDVIAEALWPSRPPADTRGNIEVLVSRIRRALGDRTLIQTGPGGYLLVDGDRCWVDAEAFLAAVKAGQAMLAERPGEALVAFREALGIWRGEPLAEDAYLDWAQEDRRHLSLAFLQALEGAATAALSTGNCADAATWAGQALSREPLRETSAMLVVQALAASGDQAGALAAFDSFRGRLATEMGLDPSPAAQELRQRVLRGERLQAGLGRWPTIRHGRPPWPEPFIGRRDECAAILAAATGRGPRVLLVTGPSGIGKSRLLTECARMVHVQMTALAVQAFAPDRNEALALAGRLLRQAWDLADAAGIALSDREAQALAELIPGIPRLAHATADLLGEENRRAFALQGAVRLVEAAAKGRCLLVVDDLHWADPVSLSMLGLILRRVDGVTMVAAYRHDGPKSACSAAADALGITAADLESIALGPLPPDQVRELFSDPSLANVIMQNADHTPFALAEIMAALAGPGVIRRDDSSHWRLRSPGDLADALAVTTAGLRKMLEAKLATVPSRERDPLALLALLGRPAPSSLLADAGGWRLRDVVEALEGLARAGLACPGQHGWALEHELFSQALVGALHPAERARLHTLLAQALRRAGADPAEVAGHLLGSCDRHAATAAYAAAARRQLERACDDEAMRLAETGLSLDPSGHDRGSLLEVRGEACRRRGWLTEARADLTSAMESFDNPAARSRVLAELAILEARTAGVTRGSDLIELAVAEAGSKPDALGQALAAGAIIDLMAGNLGRAEHRSRQARRLLERAGDSRASARLLYWRAMLSFIAGRLREAVTQFDHLAHLPVTPAEILRLWNPRATRGHALAFLAQPGAGLKEIDESLSWARAVRYQAVQSSCLWHRSEALAFLGRADEAIESAREALTIATSIRHAEWTAASLRGLGIAWEIAGELEQAQSAFRRSLRAAEGEPIFSAWASARLGACLSRMGLAQDAAVQVGAAMRQGTPLTRYEALWARAELLAARGDDEACRLAATDALQKALKGGYLILVPRLRELAGT